MSKIVQAINAMIANPELITNVIQGQDELFFLYKGKYKWSIVKREDGIRLWYYPGITDLELLASFEGPEWEGIPMVSYADTDIGTKEAKASFIELYTIIKESAYGVNAVLDDIIFN